MAVLLAWMSWDATTPDAVLWERLLARARRRIPGAGAGEVVAASGMRAFALPTRARAPAPLHRLPDGRVALCDHERAESIASLVTTPCDSAAAVVVLDANDKVLHSQLVPEIADEPDYETALKVL